MELKFYFRTPLGKPEILPMQDFASFNVDDYKYVFADGIKLGSTKATFLGSVKFIEGIDTLKITSILSELPIDAYVNNAQKNELVKQNTKVFAKVNSVKQSKYTKPDTLYTSDINWEIATIGLELGEFPLFIGPKGCGKDQFARDLSIGTDREFFPINCGAIFKPKQTLIGTMQVKDGNTYVVDSEFLKYYKSEKPTLIFLNELSRIPAGAANYLLTAIDKIDPYLYVEELGKRVHKGKNVVFASAANFGYEYTDTRNVDGALLDRFTKIMVNYLEQDEEIKLITERVPNSDIKDVRKLVTFANQCREDKNLRVAVSTRQLISMAKFMGAGISLSDVKEHIFVNLFINGSMDETETVTKLLNAVN